MKDDKVFKHQVRGSPSRGERHDTRTQRVSMELRLNGMLRRRLDVGLELIGLHRPIERLRGIGMGVVNEVRRHNFGIAIRLAVSEDIRIRNLF
jgi:hypothetical protein